MGVQEEWHLFIESLDIIERIALNGGRHIKISTAKLIVHGNLLDCVYSFCLIISITYGSSLLRQVFEYIRVELFCLYFSYL